MRNPFNIRKDINQIKETVGKIGEKIPLIVLISKLIFIVFKWLIILFIILGIICVIITAIMDYKKEQEKKQGTERSLESFLCEKKCNFPQSPCKPLDCIMPTLEQEKCYEDCFGLPSLRGVGIPK